MRQMSSTNRTTVVDKKMLIDRLEANLDAHLKEYQEAVDGYKQEAKVKLQCGMEKAQEKIRRAYERTLLEIENFDPEQMSDVLVFCEAIRFDLVAPKNYADAYEQAIEMLKWEQRQEVELTAQEFRCFIMNKWDWMEDFVSSSARYFKKA